MKMLRDRDWLAHEVVLRRVLLRQSEAHVCRQLVRTRSVVRSAQHRGVNFILESVYAEVKTP